MKRVLVFQHVAYEILGTFHPLLKKAGFRIRYANFGRHPDLTIDMERYDGLIILGGPMGVYESKTYPHLTEEIRSIRQAIQSQKPVLGICLGAQLIAAALGAEVKLGTNKEIGWCDVTLTADGKKDPILGEMEKTEKLFQWHRDVFQIPDGATWLAKSEACPNQGFRYGDKVYGFQFHLEVDEHMIERWLNIPDHKEELFALSGNELPNKIRSETHEHLHRLKELSRKVFSRYIQLFSTKRRTSPPSGHK